MVVVEITVEELHEQTAEVLTRVQAGQPFRIMDPEGWPLAELAVVERKRTWVSKEELFSIPRPDPGMWEDIKNVRRWLAGEDV